MEFIRFIFSSFWIWLGFVLMILIVGAVAIAIVKEIKKPNQQKIKESEATAEYWRVIMKLLKTNTRKGGETL